MQIQKVTDPTKAVTDPVLLAALARQGIDKDYVELWHDYAPRSMGKGYSPYSKLYRDLNSSQQIMVVSGLPMIDAYGQGHELTWQDRNGSIENGNNIFHVIVKENDTRLIALSDQPGGVKKDDEVFFHPQLFIGGGEVQPVSPLPRLLETDPDNQGYNNNVLEWDYGVCRRRLRIIEGRLRGSWVFTADPGNDVLIRYNQRGGLRLRLQYARGGDEEFIPEEYFTGKELPVIISDSATFYPDANPESSSVDGYLLQHVAGGDTFANVRNGPGTGSYDATISGCVEIVSGSTANKWTDIARTIMLFLTSSLPDDAVISAAVLSAYGYNKIDDKNWQPNINVYSSAPASNTAIVPGDFDSLGTTAFCDTAITYSGWSTAGYNDFTLNASGIAAISKTGVSKFGLRNANYDVANSAPTWASLGTGLLYLYCTDKGAGYKPKLVVTYAAGEQKTSADNGSGAELISTRSMEGVDQGSGAETGLTANAVFAGDAGSGNDTGGLAQSFSFYSGDQGGGADSLKLVSEEGGGDMRLHSHQSQVGLPHKEVRK